MSSTDLIMDNEKFTAFLERKGWDSSDLDELVHDIKSREGAGINNGGIMEQVTYLMESGMSAAEIWKQMSKAPVCRDCGKPSKMLYCPNCAESSTCIHDSYHDECDTCARLEVEQSLFKAGIIEDPDMDGGLLG